MIEHADTRDGRYTTLIDKLNEVIDEVNSLRADFEASILNFDNHTHAVLPEGSLTIQHTRTGGPLITMVDESEARDGP